ncbi:hypothetical protein A6302_00437 [Methylobrevis pamukkalensis]|uniref:Uncharacterized protein n=1 Tax=Methylobrevis pamukkalensis TaxID=1439726 RepID=A0A1E3H7E0_9HYPH|nr:hypothetical protein A6302_00437 [Methylobrevis pamukkalensis]
MTLATLLALCAYAGWFGAVAEALAPFVALAVSMVAAPAIAWATGGRYYLARKPRANWKLRATIECRVCQHAFEPEDMAFCPAYSAPICSLCCSLDARCHDLCKPGARLEAQIDAAVDAVAPRWLVAEGHSRLGTYLASSPCSLASSPSSSPSSTCRRPTAARSTSRSSGRRCGAPSSRC